MNGENYPENSIPKEFGLTNSNPKDFEDQNESNQFTQPFPQQENNFSTIYYLNDIQNINYLIINYNKFKYNTFYKNFNICEDIKYFFKKNIFN